MSDYVVSVAHLKDVLIGNEISFTTPFDTTKQFTATVVYYDYQDSLNYAWAGKLDDDYGYLVLLRKPDGIIGYIQTPLELYFIHPVGHEHAVLIEKNLEFPEEYICSMDSVISMQQSLDICDDDFDRCPAVIDVLAVITDNALAWLDLNFPILTFELFSQMITLDLRAVFMELSYLNCNIALINSEVPNKRFRFRTILENVPLTTNSLNDVNNLATNDDIMVLRDDFRADLVIALTNQAYGNVFGRVFAIGPNTNAIVGISQIRFSNAPRFTLAHELAHLFGARHDTDTDGTCEHGFLFQDQNRVDRRTILAASPATVLGPGGRELHFSNPEVFINGAASGTANDNNARVLRNAGCTVAGYKLPPEWASFISSFDVVCRNELTFQACAFIMEPGTGFPGEAPYTYEWHYSVDGGTSIYLGDDECESVTPPVSGAFMYFFLTITSDDNLVNHHTKIVKILDTSDPPCALTRPEVTNFIVINEHIDFLKFEYQITPNPSRGLFSIRMSNRVNKIDEHVVTAELSDLHGKPHINMLINLTNSESEFDISKLPPGTYILKVTRGEYFSYHKIIKL